MRRVLWVAGALVCGIVAGVAADGPIAARQALMKANGKATKDVVPMLKGVAPFNQETVQAALNQYIETADKGPALFPPGSDKGDTKALPAVWTNKADFDARFAKLGADARTASASILDAASFKAKFGPVLKNCQDCHETYRAADQ